MRRMLRSARRWFHRPLLDQLARIERQVFLLRLQQAGSGPPHDPRSLRPFGYSTYSQYDEDGLLDEVFARIGTEQRVFVELGVGDGLENNTAALLVGGWSGVWVDADARQCERIRSVFADALSSERLTLVEAFVRAETIDGLLEPLGLPQDVDLLSIDIDGNDYWVWERISAVRPRVVVIEYNASFGRTAAVVQPYDSDAVWDETSAFGASLAALDSLAGRKGYRLVGCSNAGVNAIFVRNDLGADLFQEPATPRVHFEPPRFGAAGTGHVPSWTQLESVDRDG